MCTPTTIDKGIPMAEFAYTTVPGKIGPLLEKIRKVGIPTKATVQWLKSVGFTSSNDGTLLGVIKVVGFVDASGIPTSVWSGFRGAKYKQVLADAIKTGYDDLFAVYPDAWQTSTSDLEHVFNTTSSAGAQVIKKTVGTFKALCALADFGSIEQQTSATMDTGPIHTPLAHSPSFQSSPASKNSPTPSVHIDIQIHISPEASMDQIDQIFKSMAKHLYGAKDA